MRRFVPLLMVTLVFAGCATSDRDLGPVPEPCTDIPEAPEGNPGSRFLADAGPDQNAKQGRTVTLDGSGTLNRDGANLTYAWTQLLGPCVVLSDPHAVQPKFEVPAVPDGNLTIFRFRLVVSSGDQVAPPDEVDIFVQG